MPIISPQGGGGGSGAISGVTVTGTAASGQVPVASSSSAGAWAYPPGFVINTTSVTGVTNITDTSEATATALISPGALTFDGTAVLVEFMGIVKSPSAAAGNFSIITLFEGATQITRLGIVQTAAAAVTVCSINCHYVFTPTAASHTYTVCGFASNTTGTPAIIAGTGGTGGYPPALVRFTKV